MVLVLLQLRQQVLERAHEMLVVGLAHVMAVDVLQLGEIEPGGGTPDAAEIESVDHLLGREDLLIAMAPAKADKIIPKRLGQIAHAAIGLDAQRSMTLR